MKRSSKPFALIIVFAFAILVAKPACSSAQSEFDSGMTDYKSGAYKKAAGHFWQSITDGNGSPQAWLYLAHSYAASGNKDAALKTYQQIITKFRNTDVAKVAQKATQRLSPAGASVPSTTVPTSVTTTSVVKQNAESGSTQRDLPDRARVFYRPSGDDIMVTVRINGRPIEMELDTGAPDIVLSRKDIISLGLIPPGGKADGTSGGASNSLEAEYWNMPASVQVGPIRFDKLSLTVFDEMQTHPLLGQNFFKDFDYTIDHSSHCIEFRKKGTTHATTSTAYTVPFEFRENGSRIVVEVEINGKKAPVMFDTGNASSGISFDNKKQMTKFGLSLPSDARLSSSNGVTGSGQCYRFKINRVKLGPIEKHDLNAELDLDVEDDEDLPLIGQEFWRGWQYTIDMKNRQVHFLRR